MSKIIRAKRVGGMAPVVECLSSKHKALSSKPSTTKKTKQKKPQNKTTTTKKT
jgi:hypothetical protein